MKTKNGRKKLIHSLAEELRRKRAALLDEVAGTEQDWERMTQEREPELEEAAQIERLSTVLDRLDDRQQQQLREIDQALQRIAAGDYGKCEKCGEPILVERLCALPMARFCVECASELERKKNGAAKEEQAGARMPADFSVLKEDEG